MEIKVVTGDIVKTKADAIVIPFFKDNEQLSGDIANIDQALDGAITQLNKRGEIKGKLNEITIIHCLGKLPSERVAVIGLGKKEELTKNKIRGAIAETCRRLRQSNMENIAFIPQGIGLDDIDLEIAAQIMTEGALLGTYTFQKYVTSKEEHSEIKQLLILGRDDSEVVVLEQGYRKGKIIAEAANLARDMVNEPSNNMTPTDMAEMAKKLADTYKLELTILNREQMKDLGMGALLGVAQGSQQPPKFIVLRYSGGDSSEIDVALVGKGITFDSGGISIKPSNGMEEMKSDMTGGATVMAAISAIAQIKPEINVMAIIPATENLPSGTALKPGDILTAMNGKTIEILSTDAEGRLILADAISYARKLGAKSIIDVATLTGACIIALGKVCTGAFGNNQELINKVLASGMEAGELIWQMPMFDEFKELNKSSIADVKNVGGREAGSITAAQFLAEFTDDIPWVHLDIAGTSMTEKERNYQIKGATGVPVRTLINLVLSLAK
ncbi:MAG: leucyl aminopeptidase [Dehalococcoidales bacterium]|nr:leucyl aminopeptidase [Dehalococcoidales bacterium]